MDVISFAGRAIDTLKSIDSKCTCLPPLPCARDVGRGCGSLLARVILTMSLGTLLSSCGGGGGGGSGGSSPPPSPSVSLSTNSLTQTSLTTDVAPSVTLTATVTNAPTAGIYIAGAETNNGIQTIQLGSQIGTTAAINIYLKSPSSLAPNTYTDTVQLKFCLDKACTSQITNSPQTVTVKFTVNLPDPVLQFISATSIYAGSPGFTLSLSGSAFASQSTARLNGSARPTTLVSAGQINMQISAADIARAGTVQITVSNASGGGGVSAALPLQIQPASLSTLSTQSVSAGSPGFILTVSGYGYWPQSVIQWNGSSRPTTYTSAGQLSAQISTNDLIAAGTYPVTVLSASGDVSNALNVVVRALPALSLSSVAPASVTAGGPLYTMVLTGTGFTTQSVAKWNGVALNTTYLSPTELLAVVPATDIATTSTVSVVVSSGAATSASSSVSVVPPSKDAVAFQLNATHSGTISFNAVALPTSKKWTVNVGGSPSFAVITNGKVYLTVNAAGNSKLVVLDQATGANTWGPVSLAGPANATYDSGVLLVLSASSTTGGLLQAFDPTSGNVLWSTGFITNFGVPAAPTAAGGVVYTGASYLASDELIGFDVKNGTQVWGGESVLNGSPGSPAVTADGVYVSYPCAAYDFRPYIYALAWSNISSCTTAGGATPVVANGILYSPNAAGSYSGTTLDAQSGAVLGSYVADSPPAISSTTGYFLQSGTLRAISLAGQSTLWSFSGDGQLVTSPILVNQYVFIGSSSGEIYALDQASGQVLWQDNVGSAIPTGVGTNAAMPLTGLSAGDGLLIVPGSNTVTTYVLSTNP
jgi:outer membrane protein assembly factor BamB